MDNQRNLIPIGAKSELVRHINGLLSSWPCAYTAPPGFDSLKSRYKFWLRSCYIQILIFNPKAVSLRSEEHTSELQSLMRISYAVFCLKTKTKKIKEYNISYNY